jgi:lysozyme
MNLTRLQEKLIEHEGLRLKPYRCPAGKLTIGVGRNLDDVGISKDEAMTLLANDIMRCMAIGHSIFGENWLMLDEVRQEVIINMIFNLGEAGFRNFKKTIDYIRMGKYDKAGDEMLASKWAQQVPKRAYELSLAMKTNNI